MAIEGSSLIVAFLPLLDLPVVAGEEDLGDPILTAPRRNLGAFVVC